MAGKLGHTMLETGGQSENRKGWLWKVRPSPVEGWREGRNIKAGRHSRCVSREVQDQGRVQTSSGKVVCQAELLQLAQMGKSGGKRGCKAFHVLTDWRRCKGYWILQLGNAHLNKTPH